ncbi:PIN domain-containing protein [Acinetobacter sp. VNH17]|uniref:PIN domain-containing protein n=1 Tax=Acinetobacter thutiue TaxID=2998078 RepID=A0ABT7WMJ2_9GAMM|nr:PIN domain-containing protein [Acinetobacter thutiue]MCY6411798.1 PIN domain-containing protein [Acinetobacter thutiue]MDN0013900.1 PIN domain-containing protein [Acinetobacter thutiue]
MKTYVLDTHAWIWQLFKPEKLGHHAKLILEQADQNQQVNIIIPAVVLAEVSMIAQKQRVVGFKAEHIPILVSTIQQHPAYSFSILDQDIILASQKFTDIPDIFDRLITTESYLLNATLISCDSIIHASQAKDFIIW